MTKYLFSLLTIVQQSMKMVVMEIYVKAKCRPMYNNTETAQLMI